METTTTNGDLLQCQIPKPATSDITEPYSDWEETGALNNKCYVYWRGTNSQSFYQDWSVKMRHHFVRTRSIHHKHNRCQSK